MATDTAISGLPTNPGVASNDVLEVLDVSNTTNQATGENTKATVAALAPGLPALVGDTGAGGTKGLVPAPASGDAAAGKYLKADGTWAVPAGGGGGGTPGGSSGQVQYNSSGTFAGASKVSIGATSGELILGSISAPTISGTGQVWNDSGRFGIVVAKGGGSGPVNVPLWTGVNCTAVANTASWTSLLAGGTQRGSLTIDGTKLAVGQYLAWDLFGTYGCTASTPTLAMRMLVNGTVVGLTAAQTFASAQSDKYWVIAGGPQIRLWILATGVSGSIICVGQTQSNSDVHGFFFSAAGTGSTASPAAVTVDLSGSSVALDFQVKWSAVSATNTIKAWGASVELRG